MMHIILLTAAAAVTSCAAIAQAGAAAVPDPQRVREIAAMLPVGRSAAGPPVEDRAAWDSVAGRPELAGIVTKAEQKIAEPVPALTAEIYGEFAKTGQRTKHYTDVRYNRHERIALYTLAECVENKGRFIKPLESIINDVCDEPTWLFNFHDKSLDGWNGKGVWIDLGAVMPASDMAIALALLGDRIDPATQKRIVDTCRARIFDPYHRMIDEQPGSWAYSEMNWNAVCHSGVVATALGALPDPAERAYFVATAEKLSVNYLRGLGSDGYCAEGVGYWNYGFGHFTEMSELVRRATNGRIDLLGLPGADIAAKFPARMEIINGMAASYADCVLNPKPDAHLFNLLDVHFGLGLPPRETDGLPMRLSPMLTYLFAPVTTTTRPAAAGGVALRDYFDHGGVLVCRPAPSSTGRLGVSLKGGYNDEPHNHNDLGTFVVAVGHHLPILDPGLELYSARTFSKDRYQSKLLNSYGHPVPVVAGQLQRQGADARARVVTADFSDEKDVYAMDIKSAYDVPALDALTRTFTYDRTGPGTLAVQDNVAFITPQAFGTALITYEPWKRTGDDTLEIGEGNDRVRVRIDTGGLPFDVHAETIDEQTPGGAKPTRIGIDLKAPLRTAVVTTTVSPAD